ncbi:hypothetical protein AJ80_02927 [Polytolypa hystricis UAMH7299]|uniref:C2H2-type domain-containing protein n=1 Tax=Polytolypa hystricis (strain UAMH7299) TaxID=1447883 RepID=A0A2B7YQ76_POLH7|nr:hypothetical protein AJ80_02927 [Polytolypa hystricis UAMH7299]
MDSQQEENNSNSNNSNIFNNQDEDISIPHFSPLQPNSRLDNTAPPDGLQGVEGVEDFQWHRRSDAELDHLVEQLVTHAQPPVAPELSSWGLQGHHGFQGHDVTGHDEGYGLNQSCPQHPQYSQYDDVPGIPPVLGVHNPYDIAENQQVMGDQAQLVAGAPGNVSFNPLSVLYPLPAQVPPSDLAASLRAELDQFNPSAPQTPLVHWGGVIGLLPGAVPPSAPRAQPSQPRQSRAPRARADRDRSASPRQTSRRRRRSSSRPRVRSDVNLHPHTNTSQCVWFKEADEKPRWGCLHCSRDFTRPKSLTDHHKRDHRWCKYDKYKCCINNSHLLKPRDMIPEMRTALASYPGRLPYVLQPEYRHIYYKPDSSGASSVPAVDPAVEDPEDGAVAERPAADGALEEDMFVEEGLHMQGSVPQGPVEDGSDLEFPAAEDPAA